MKTIKQYLLVAVILLLGASILWQQKPEEKANPAVEYRYQIDKPRVVSYSKGEKRWDLVAESIVEPKNKKEKKKEKDKKTILKNVKDGKMYKDGELKYRLDADKIIYYNQSKDITLQDNVKLEQVNNGKEIRSSRLEWINSTELLKTNSGVRIVLPDGGKLTAEKLTINVKDEIIDLDQQVEMSFIVKGAEK